jgi:hypothetical protein
VCACVRAGMEAASQNYASAAKIPKVLGRSRFRYRLQTLTGVGRPSSEPSSAVDLPERGSDRFSKPSAAFMIGDTVTRATIGDYINSEENPGPDTISASDRRHKVNMNKIT